MNLCYIFVLETNKIFCCLNYYICDQLTYCICHSAECIWRTIGNIFARLFQQSSLQNTSTTQHDVNLDLDDDLSTRHTNYATIASNNRAKQPSTSSYSYNSSLPSSSIFSTGLLNDYTYNSGSPTSDESDIQCVQRTPKTKPHSPCHSSSSSSSIQSGLYRHDFYSQTSPNDESLPSEVPKGLKNLGNTCYMSAVIQSLYSIESFRNLILRSSHDKILNSGKLIISLRFLTQADVDSYPLRTNLVGVFIITKLRVVRPF